MRIPPKLFKFLIRSNKVCATIAIVCENKKIWNTWIYTIVQKNIGMYNTNNSSYQVQPYNNSDVLS